jgi:glutamate 5-kinase
VNLKAATTISQKQACAAIGQARLMTTYQRIFSEYNHQAAQILMTRHTIVADLNRTNAQNTFNELLGMGVIPIVNENDTTSTFELDDVVGDNDTLSAIVTALTGADLLILLSDINGLYTDDPRKNKSAQFIERVDTLTDELISMGKGSTGSSVGTGGMETKLTAAKIATYSGADMIIANGKDVRIIHRIMEGRNYGTIFKENKNENFDFAEFVNNLHK